MRKNSTVMGRFTAGALAVLVGLALFAGTAAAQTITITAVPDEISELGGTKTGKMVADASATSKVTVTITPKTGSMIAEQTMIDLVWGGTATVTADYAVTFPLGQTGVTVDENNTLLNFSAVATVNKPASAVLTVMVVEDAIAEGVERVNVSAAPNDSSVGQFAAPQAVEELAIADNDNPGVSTLTLSVAPKLLKESGDTEAARTAKVTVLASANQTFTTPQTIVLELGGDATQGDDYTIAADTLVLDAGKTKVETKLIVLNDSVYDGPIMETVRISAFVGTVQIGTTETVQLEDNDQNPENFTLSVSPASVAEGETATVTVTAKAALAADQKFMLTVTGTATANEDFTLAPDLTVAKAATKGSTLLQAVKDSVSGEADETVMITATAGGIMVGTATVTIKGDTATPTTPTPTSDLGAPTIEDVKAGAKMLTVMWSAVEGATGYMVQWKTKSQSYGATRQASTTQMTHSIMELTNGMEYMVRVRGMKGDAYGKWSEEAMGTPTGETAVPTPALPVFGAFALAAGLVTAGRRRLRTRQRALLTD
jgi:hypothetical protein